jgi:hypothetical protein
MHYSWKLKKTARNISDVDMSRKKTKQADREIMARACHWQTKRGEGERRKGEGGEGGRGREGGGARGEEEGRQAAGRERGRARREARAGRQHEREGPRTKADLYIGLSSHRIHCCCNAN